MFTRDYFYFTLFYSAIIVSCLFTEYQWELEMESGSMVFLLPLTDIRIRFPWAFSFPAQTIPAESCIRDITFQPLRNLHNHSMNLLQCGHASLVLGSLEKDVVSLLLSRGELSPPLELATLLDESKYAVGLPCYKWHPAHCELCIHQNSRAFVCQATCQLVNPKTIQEYGVFLPQVQDLAFPYTELHRVPGAPFLQLLEIPLNNKHIHLLYQSLLSSTDLLRMISVPSPRSFMNTLDSSSWASIPRAHHF